MSYKIPGTPFGPDHDTIMEVSPPQYMMSQNPSLLHDRLCLNNPLKSDVYQQALQRQHSLALALLAVVKLFPSGAKRKNMEEVISKILTPVLDQNIKIALSGPGGVGKSTLVNALCGDRYLTKTGANGAAVTNIVQEIKQRAPGENAPYTLECTYHPEHEVRNLLETLLDDYRRFDLDKIDEQDEDYKPALDNHNTSRAILETVFEDLPEFNLDELMYGEHDITREDVVKKIFDWFDKIPGDIYGGEGQFRQTFDQGESCRDAVNKVQTHPRWPFTNKLSVAIDSDVLRDGLIIGDLPGSLDWNYVRAKAAREYIATADEIWLVANIARVTTNSDIKAIIDQYYPETRSSAAVDVGNCSKPKITIICTHAGLFPIDCPLEDEDGAKLMGAEIALAQANKRVAEANDDEEKAKAKYDLLRLKMHIRNSYVFDKLNKKYVQQIAPQELTIFCVDSNMAWKDGQHLQLSGMLQLQEYAASRMSKRRFEAHNRCMEHDLPTFLDALAAWSRRLTEEADGLVNLEFPNSSGLRSKDGFKLWQGGVSSAITKLVGPLKRKSPVINDAARRMVEQIFSKLPSPTIRAHCRKLGPHCYKRGKGVLVCWNAELAKHFNKVSAKQWQQLEKLLDETWTASVAKVLEPFHSQQEQYEQLEASSTTTELLKSTTERLHESMRTEKNSFMVKLRDIKTRATSGGPNSYVARYLTPFYRSCMQEFGQSAMKCVAFINVKRLTRVTGKSVTRRRITILANAVRAPEFVSQYVKHLKGNCDRLKESTKINLNGFLNQAVDLIAPEGTTRSNHPGSKPYFTKFPNKREEIQKQLSSIKSDYATLMQDIKPTQERARKLGWIGGVGEQSEG